MYSRNQLAKRPLAGRLITKLHDSDNKIVNGDRRSCGQPRIGGPQGLGAALVAARLRDLVCRLGGRFMRFEGTSGYVATDDLKVSVNAAIALERPLLVKGEPGNRQNCPGAGNRQGAGRSAD